MDDRGSLSGFPLSLVLLIWPQMISQSYWNLEGQKEAAIVGVYNLILDEGLIIIFPLLLGLREHLEVQLLDAVNHWFVQGQDCFFVWMSRLVNQETDWLAKGGTSFMGYIGHLLPINSLGLLCIWCVEFGGPCCWFLIFSMFKVTLFLHPISFLL